MDSLKFGGGWGVLPLGPRPVTVDGCPQHVDIQLRTEQQRMGLRRLVVGLDLSGARLADGKRVTNNVETMLWLLERIYAEEEDRGEEAAGRAEP